MKRLFGTLLTILCILVFAVQFLPQRFGIYIIPVESSYMTVEEGSLCIAIHTPNKISVGDKIAYNKNGVTTHIQTVNSISSDGYGTTGYDATISSDMLLGKIYVTWKGMAFVWNAIESRIGRVVTALLLILGIFLAKNRNEVRNNMERVRHV